MQAIETVYNGHRFRSRLEARWAVFFDTLGVRWEYEKEGYDLGGEYYLPDFWLPDLGYWIEIKGQPPTKEEYNKTAILAMSSNSPAYIFYGGIWVPGKDDTEQVDIYDTGDLHTVKKSSAGFLCDRDFANLVAHDTTSPCYRADCPHERRSPDDFYGCPYTHFVANRGEEGQLVRSMYLAEMNHSIGDSCKLRLSPDNKLHFYVYRHPRYAEMHPLPSQIQEKYDDFVTLLSRFSPSWEWRAGGKAGTILPDDGYRWCQCSYCGKFGITPMDKEQYLPCHRRHKHAQSYHGPVQGRDSTEDLIAAYTAARQARFEYGESSR